MKIYGPLQIPIAPPPPTHKFSTVPNVVINACLLFPVIIAWNFLMHAVHLEKHPILWLVSHSFQPKESILQPSFVGTESLANHDTLPTANPLITVVKLKLQYVATILHQTKNDFCLLQRNTFLPKKETKITVCSSHVMIVF